jgi:hypothetical protein
MQFWKGQRIVFKGLMGTVYQDQGLDQTVKITLDREGNMVFSVNPKKLSVQSQESVAAFDYFVGRKYLP